MALTRKFLSALGIEPEKIDEIIEAHTDTVNALKEERDGYKKDAELLPGVQKELDELRIAADQNKDNPYMAQYEKLKDEFDEYKGQQNDRYNALKEEYDNYKADVDNEKIKARKEAAFRSVLKEAGIIEKYIDSIVKISDVDSYELTDDGKIKDHDSVLEKLKEEHSDFVEVKTKEGADKNDPPGGGTNKMTKEEIFAIKDRNERQKAISENHELFGY